MPPLWLLAIALAIAAARARRRPALRTVLIAALTVLAILVGAALHRVATEWPTA